jgi:hypothetical protein
MKRAEMNGLIAVLVLASGLFTTGLWAETQGTFVGEVVRAPRGEHSAGLLYLRGRDGNVRRVVVTRAAIEYDAAVAKGDRVLPARRALVPGTEVRVTALVDADSGEWTASRVEVIAHHAASFEEDYGDGEPGSGPDQVTAPKEPTLFARTV